MARLKAVASLLVLTLLALGGLVAVAPSASAATGTIQGTVTGLTTGTAVDAWVFVYSAEPETDVFTDPCNDDGCVGYIRTSGSGAFAVTGLTPGSYKVFVQSNDATAASRWYGGKGDTYAAATAVVAPNGGQTTIAVKLTTKGGISGTVSDDTGVKSGVTVTAYRVNGDGTQDPTGKNTTTNGSGQYLIPALASGNYRLYAVDPAHVGRWNGGASTFATAPNVVVADGAETTGVGFTLARYGSISGKVRDAAAAAVSGATVEAHRVDGTTDGGVARTATTGADGSYPLGTLTPGSYRVRAVPTGLSSGPAWNGNATSFATAANITVANGGAVTGTDIGLPALPGGISGTITPVFAGTTVTAIPYGGAGDSVTGPVDGSGKFELALPAGSYLLAIDAPASRPDYPRAWVYRYCDWGCTWVTRSKLAGAFDIESPVQVEAGVVTSGITATLPQVPVLAGRITDSAGDPVANASVQLWLRGRIDPVFTTDDTEWDLYGHNACAGDYYAAPQPCVTATTDAEGDYLIYPPRTWPDGYYADQQDYLLLVVPGDGLHRPRWVGAATDANLPATWPAPADMFAGEWTAVPGYGNSPELLDLDQVLSGAGRFAGTVTTAGGPVGGIAVRVHANLDDGSPLAGRDYTTTTASDGTWSIGGLPPGGYSVYFGDGSDHYVPLAYDGGAGMLLAAYQSRTGIDGVLQSGGSVTGTITGDPGSGPVPLAGATVHAYLPAGGEVGSATTGDDGSYTLTLDVGTYRLRVTPPAGAEYAARWYGTDATSQATAADVQVTLGADTNADARLTFTGHTTPPPAVTVLSIKPGATQTVAGKRVVVTGALRTITGQPVAGAVLTLQARAGTSGAFRTVGTATTSATGTVSISVAPTAATTYRWVYGGDTDHLATTGPATAVKVAFALTAKAVKRALSHKKAATVWGAATPARAGTTVVLQQLVKGSWRTLSTRTTVRKVRLPGAARPTLGYVLTFKKRKGAYTFRAITLASSANLKGTSAAVRIRFT
ncbi:carboxypeptidase-like regulatory domain-containing protein [Nocardioides marmoriginsengisoli]|uniref:carboxypeptidase-like regulatory domain-containing protein n=1 Tax=Nocardioides marmoriginsengisoli TaxID=661483 RepID=UPI00161C3886|nr:carboxypeptidase-like regulatory domain-containing protein [Nocardioides marmoriginsengisoli]